MSVTGASTSFFDRTHSTDASPNTFEHANRFQALAEASEATAPGATVQVQAAILNPIFQPIPINAPTPFAMHSGSAFLNGGEGSEPLGAGPAHAQMLREEGVKHGVHKAILDAFAGECPTLENFFTSYQCAAQAVQHCQTTGKDPDLNHAPLAQKMAVLLWQLHQRESNTVQAATPTEDSHTQENAVGAPPS